MKATYKIRNGWTKLDQVHGKIGKKWSRNSAWEKANKQRPLIKNKSSPTLCAADRASP
jgi:hypothetical protein